MHKKIVGFTLAEVLLTLAIVGIVAALTIPSVISSTQKQQWVTGLQKSVAMLDQMVKQLNVDNGCSSFDCVISSITTSSYPAKNNQFADIIKQKLSYTKLCYGDEPFGGICYPASWKNLGGTSETIFSGHAKFLMSDGSCIAFYLNSANCDRNDVIINGANVHCAYAEVDVNCFNGQTKEVEICSKYNFTNMALFREVLSYLLTNILKTHRNAMLVIHHQKDGFVEDVLCLKAGE